MKVVIELDSVDYMYIKNGCIVPIKIDNHIYDAIRGGTVLPEGHDRLVEARAVIKALFGKQTIDDVPTIIEADNSEVN